MADRIARRYDDPVTDAIGYATRLVVGALVLICPVSGRGSGGAAAGPASHCAWILPVGDTEPHSTCWCLLGQHHGAVVDLLVFWVGTGFDPLFLALYGATLGHGLQVGLAGDARRGGDFGCLAPGPVDQCGVACSEAWFSDWIGADLCSYGRRVWRSVDDGRQHTG